MEQKPRDEDEALEPATILCTFCEGIGRRGSIKDCKEGHLHMTAPISAIPRPKKKIIFKNLSTYIYHVILIL
jgi:hypothetical protein